MISPALFLAGLLALGGAVSVSAQAATFNVTKTDDGDDGACDADCSLREAVRAANSSTGPDLIQLPAGTYTLSLANTSTAEENAAARGDLDLTDSVTLQGNGAAATIIQWDTTNPSDPTGTDNGLLRDRILDIRSGSGNLSVTLKDLTLQNGYSSPRSVTPSPFEAGGAIRVDGALGFSHALIIENCILKNNSSRGGNGGAISITKNVFNPTLPELTITGSEISGNKGAIGGGVNASNVSLTLTDSVVTGNAALTANPSEPVGGGGLYLSGSSGRAQIIRNTITGNSAARPGGGIGVFSASASLIYNRIVGNSAGLSSGNGLFSDGGTLNAENNWWGANADPSAGAPTQVALNPANPGTADVTPWLKLNLAAVPSTLFASQTADLTADLTVNSDGIDTTAITPSATHFPSFSGSRHLPNGSTVAFAATAGTVTPETAPLAGGRATVTYTAGGSGSATVSATTDGVTVSQDLTILVPDTTLTATPSDLSNDNSPTFEFTSGASGATFECNLDGGAFESCASPKTYADVADGSHTFQVRSVVGSAVDASPASFAWTIDTVAPETTITVSPAAATNATSASFEFVSDEAGATFECSLDGGAYESCASPKSYTGLSEGSHTFAVKARDAAGNTDGSPASFDWTVDSTPPTLTLASSSSNPTGVSPIPVTATFSEDVTGFTAGDVSAANATVQDFVSLSGSAYSFNLVPTAIGSVTAGVPAGAAADAAGNASAASNTLSRDFVAPPTVTITHPASGTVAAVGTPITIRGVFTAPAGAICGPYTSTWTINGVPEAGILNESTGEITLSRSFAASGIYKVTLKVSDSCGQSATTDLVNNDLIAFVVVYDPDAGHVTGGGWFSSAPGSLVSNPDAAGKASFGFVAKYKNGTTTPEGNTEFRLQAANFSFRSTAYEWMVNSGGFKAQFQGSGTVNGVAGYEFRITLIDGDKDGGGGADRIRVKIWDSGGTVIYDNVPGSNDDLEIANPQIIGGGSIVIHKSQ